MIADHFLQLRTDVEAALIGLLRLVAEIKQDATTADTLHGLLANIREPLLFVVVGEVKSGKSSLLNALFGREFAKADVLPVTDKISIFRYGKEERTVNVSPQLIERYLPINFLQDFNIVDTPGTNTMVNEHQEITEQFVPRADLVLFVFSVINPWTQSAWDFLGLVQQRWLKNTIFVLQQADLRDPAEVAVIQRHLEDTALQRLGFAPAIFAVSARQALLARTKNTDERLWQESHFAALEEQINRIVTDSSAGMLKLKSAWQTGQVVLGEIASEIREAFRTIKRDEERLDRITRFLQSRQDQTFRQGHGFLRGIDHACRECGKQGIRLLEQRLTFWVTLKMIWRPYDWQRDFQAEMEAKLRQLVQPQIENAVQLLETDLRGIWPQLQDMIDTQFGRDAKSQAPRMPPDFARQRRELLQSIQLTLAERVAGHAVEEQLAIIFRETSDRLRIPAGVAAAGGLVALVAAMSSAAIADVTGVLAVSAAIVGSLLAQRQRQKILRTYAGQMETKRDELVRAIEEQITHAINIFYSEISAAFRPLAAFCAAQCQRHQPIVDRLSQLEAMFERLRPQVSADQAD